MNGLIPIIFRHRHSPNHDGTICWTSSPLFYHRKNVASFERKLRDLVETGSGRSGVDILMFRSNCPR